MAMIVHVLLSLWGSILHYPESQNQEVLHAAKIAACRTTKKQNKTPTI